MAWCCEEQCKEVDSKLGIFFGPYLQLALQRAKEKLKMSDYLTRKEVADLFKLPIRTLDYLVASKQLPFSRIGKRNVRFSRARLEKWFESRENIEFHRNMQKTA